MSQNTDVNPYSVPPTFTRGQLAKILGCSTLTISNQEKKGAFPQPRRLGNGYRVYSLADVLVIQLQYKKELEFPPIFAILWSMGYTSAPDVKAWITAAVEEVQRSATTATQES